MALIRYNSYSREDIHNIYSPNTVFTSRSGKWGLHGIVSVPETQNDFVFFVTFGTTQAGHSFEEGVTEDGILTWQSQPGQKLTDLQISKFINHNHFNSNIHLLLRVSKKQKYTYLGKLAYISHNPNAQMPVQFQWQIIDWEKKYELYESIGLKLGDSEIKADPYSEPISITSTNTLVLVDNFPIPKKTVKQLGVGQRVVNIDFASKSKVSKEIGLMGEKLVYEFEMNRTKKWGYENKVEHLSLQGDGHGYDIESINEKGEKIYIEVKTTIGGINTAFDISANEVAVSGKLGDNYFIYRLFNFKKELNTAEFYIISGPLEKNFNLIPTQFKAEYKGE